MLWLRVIFVIGFLPIVAQTPFSRVRFSLDNDETTGMLQLVDSCQRAGFQKDSCLFYSAIIMLHEGGINDARKKLKTLRKDYPAFYYADYLEGLIKFRQEDYAASLSSFDKVLDQNPESFKTLYNRSLVYGMLEDYSAARQDLARCIELAPKHVQSYYSRAYWAEMSSQYNEALADYEKTVELSPRYYDAYLGMAHIYHLQKNNQKACDAISRAVEAGSQMAVDLKESYCQQ